ncbi:DEAD/DEAH box helicase [Streptomyces thermolineatus]|uniref:DEAD/DEAH box helicase n=1 Tax=Streptomyces thermolineatus TaxID=44033 RepID=A0ABP5Z8T8_9ACTN
MPDPSPHSLPPTQGLYEELVTDQLLDHMNDLRGRGWAALDAPVGDESSPQVLARHISDVACRLLAGLPAGERVSAANRILERAHEVSGSREASSSITDGPRQLLALAQKEAEGVYRVRPATPLSDSALLTNAPEDPSLGHELRAELETADSVDLLCAFVKWHGIRVLEKSLAKLRERNVPLRVITTTYIGATERLALDRLVREFGAQVKVNYELRSTRLHAKAWLFRRGSGFDTAYVGSSNLSKAALLDGLEWNVRLSSVATNAALKKFEATFDSYWNDPKFEDYDPDLDASRLDDALARAGGDTGGSDLRISLSGLEVRPYPHQKDMLERLDVERRVHGIHRNLLVAATGTGKTVMAALDYKRLKAQHGRDLTVLFVAHRQEILKQSLRTYREVLTDANFGELMVGGAKPSGWKHVFASVQSLNARGLEGIDPEHFDVVVIDEFHHAEAKTYRRIIDHFRPTELLGLTATPERMDGKHVQDEFFGGRIAAEMRLWEALEEELLSPFHYFGVSDGTDLRQVTWSRGAYDTAELSNLLTADNAQARYVINAVRSKVAVPGSMRALGFCVTVAHAEHMARAFRTAGINALALSGTTPPAEREATLGALRSGELQAVFSVDLFNEGLDVPDVDTLLLLRPTSSATVFLQQLGRGLRRSDSKPVLTVLDFIGHQNKEFRFEERYRAITGATRRGLERQVEHDFPHLPSGCQIVLEPVAKDIVLKNIRQQLGVKVNQLAEEVRSYAEVRLASYLEESRRDITLIYRSNNSWTGLLRRAKLHTAPEGRLEEALLRRVAAFLHVDDRERVKAYTALLDDHAPAYADLDYRMRTYANMLFFMLWPEGGGFPSVEAGLACLEHEQAFRDELRQVLAYGLGRAEHVPIPLGKHLGKLGRQPLFTHAHYSREEILAALQLARLDGVRPQYHVSGVAWCPETDTDALLVTLVKDEKDFSPQTLYRDHALGPDRFHWESQNATAADSPTGRRYRSHDAEGSHVLLFARQYKTTDINRGAPFMLLGPAHYVSHQGERPMQITWRLEHELPADVQHIASVAVG